MAYAWTTLVAETIYKFGRPSSTQPMMNGTEMTVFGGQNGEPEEQYEFQNWPHNSLYNTTSSEYNTGEYKTNEAQD